MTKIFSGIRHLSLKDWLIGNTRAGVEYVLVPGLIALLPFRLGVRLGWWLTRFKLLYRGGVHQAADQAQNFGFAADRQDFEHRCRFHRLMDLTDLYWSKTRSDRHIDRNFDQTGDWPADGPVMAVTFHWGGGHWGIRSLHRTGRPIVCLAGPLDPEHVGHLSVLYRYACWRTREVEKHSGRPLFKRYRGIAVRDLRDKAKSGDSILSLIDVPPGEVGGARPVTLLGRDAKLPNGLVKMAELLKLPIVFYAARINPLTARVEFRIGAPLDPTDRDAVLQEAARWLDEMIQRDPAAWMLWAQAPGFFR
ncbi:hypothetical protein C7S18_21025 [Ahniella affigens]|uniref:Lipid A biosynthesis acyltransferase n=1 Tax=Ahniella affigens TaxID=2021234 RepID=A0A2P1PXC6_9GAMM|nr:hypothetical protein [Ahniella affigens]AVP99503.1 hypothetical protein C7S18_21025 [Ahniella affigens]